MSQGPTGGERFNRAEPIPGYKTVDLLGRGGSGEVWRAIAPGGIEKAIKIVHGAGDANRAETELRALSRIKDCRHPLLLSVERIEVVDGTLILVTELADQSLKDCYVKYREAQAPGVPQVELLKYLTDAADALDFLFEKFSLQHLDVKPENILLVGGRAKIADFGLVKNLYERSVSMIGGLTPTFAPPELFEGKPSRQSDQYSLAIVYMQMLTGILPYSATSMAQLATQHLRGVPDLTALPKRQRNVIARALSKDPGQRFESCTAMVQALRDVAREPEAPPPRVAPPVGEIGVERTVALPRVLFTVETAHAGQPASLTARKPSLAAQAAIPTPPAGTNEAPVIIVGVGGAGVEVVSRLVTRLHDRFGPVAQWPRVEMLVLDTNGRTMSARFREPELARIRILPIPLKSAEDYAPRAADYLRWLGRRWFYNIPRDSTAAEFRPLGRLALLGHAKAVRDAIRDVAAKALGPAPSADDAPARSGPAPRVVLVGSISSGTGGGTLLDLSYALRGELKARGLSDEAVQGILLHATARSNADRDRARVNAFATLTELNHFSRPGGFYPGESELGAPSFHGDNATFARTHVLHLGERVSDKEWDVATDHVAELLYCTNFTPAGGVLEQAAHAVDDSQLGAAAYSYNVLSLGAGMNRIVEATLRLTKNEVVRILQEGRPATAIQKKLESSHPTAILQACLSTAPAQENPIATAVAERLRKEKLDGENCIRDAEAAFIKELGDTVENFAAAMVDEALPTTTGQPDIESRVAAIGSLIDRFLALDDEMLEGGPVKNPLFPKLVDALSVLTAERVNRYLAWLESLVNLPDQRTIGARRHASEARLALQSAYEKIVAQAAILREDAAEVIIEARGLDPRKLERPGFSWSFRRKPQEDPLREPLQPYARKRLREFLLRAAAKHVRLVDARISSVIDELDRLTREIGLLSEPVRATAPVEDDDSATKETPLVQYRDRLQELVRIRCPEIVTRIEEALDAQVLNDVGGLVGLLKADGDIRSALAQPLTETSRRVVLEAIREISCQLVTGSANSPPEFPFARMIARQFPAAGQGGADSLARVLILPDNADAAQLQPQLAAALPGVTIVRSANCDLTFCSLSAPESIAGVAQRLIEGIGAYRDLAGKLHTRVDLAWTPLEQSPPRPAAPPPAPHSVPVPADFATAQIHVNV